MKNKKRLLALLGAVFLLGMYVATLVFAMMDRPFAYTMFKICLYCTIAIPVLIYVMMLVYRQLKEKNKELYGEKPDSVIFDVGNVLVDYDWKQYLDSFGYDEEKKKILADAMFLSPVWEEADKGILTPDELTEKFVKNAPEYEQELRLLYQNPGKTITAFDYAKDWIKSLKKRGLKVYILSNYSQRDYEQTQDQLDFLPFVDGALFSFQCHMIKPDREIYDELIKKYHINPTHAVFIDDRQENVDGAEKAGLQTLRFTTYKDTSEALERLLTMSASE
jgi:putative hydrolase of the HAD superfamily